MEQNNTRTYKVKLGNGKDRKVIFNLFSSQVTIVGHNSDDVVIEGTGANTAAPARAEGLKPLYNQLEDNTGMGLSAEKENNTLTITKASRGNGKYTIKVPKDASIVFKEANWNSANLTLSEVDGEIELMLKNGNATLNNVSGPIVAQSISGNVNIKYASVDQKQPNVISTVSGKVDITLPSNTKANFNLKSLQGEIYTDFDMNLKKENKSDLNMIGGGGNIEGKTNGGGVDITIISISSDIYIRKKK
ncbi:hypothetical protein TH61_05045 [Rufibacter sp. DG15C]|nr:hypothetical protein TH61_05045 [Rufibacter sp. DG15C]